MASTEGEKMRPGVSNCADCAQPLLEMMPTYCYKLSMALFSAKIIGLLREGSRKSQQFDEGSFR